MFTGRDKEIGEFKKFKSNQKTFLMVCSGRRRIGKSSLVEHLGRSFTHFYEFQGLHPLEAPTQADQLKHFAERIRALFHKPRISFLSWTEAFTELSHLLPKKETLLFFDEISWMSSGCSTFTAELKEAWDILFKKHPQLVVAIAGSVSSWINDNILNHSNFLGRVSLHFNLKELPLNFQKDFWKVRKNFVSNYDFFRTVAITGGIPRYLEAINGNESPEQNIKRLCFTPSGFMSCEFDKIFSDIFSKRGPTYKLIVSSLIDGALNLTDLAKKMRVEKSGSLSRYVSDLVQSGFLSEDTTYDFSGRATKFTRYRVSDNYLRFALKYIEPNRARINEGVYSFKTLEDLPQWRILVGLQFENLILNNRWFIVDKLNIPRSSVVTCSPYLQKKTTKNKGPCQIDLMIVTNDFQIYVCEVKFRTKISSEVLTDVQYKLNVLKRPKHYTLHPVLIYGGELAERVKASQFFELLSLDELMD